MSFGPPRSHEPGDDPSRGSRRRARLSSTPGAARRSFLWGFWSLVLIAVVTGVDVVMRRDLPGAAAPLLLVAAAGMLSRTHHHQKALADLPPADGEDSFRRRLATKKVHERAELAWGLGTFAALAAALAVPAVLS